LVNNPAIWLESFFLIVLTIFVFFNASEFPFISLNLFTLLWTFPLIVAIHYSQSFKSLQFSTSRNIFRWLKRLTFFYFPYLLMAVIYENLLFVIETAGNIDSNFDLFFMHIDELLFSLQPTIWMQKLLHPIAVEYFMIAYGLFFIYPFFYLIYLLQKNQVEYFQKVMFAELIMLIVSLSCFVLFPTWGPRFVLDSQSPLFIQQTLSYTESIKGISIPWLYTLTGYPSFYSMQVDLWNYLERIKTDCFPSLHTGLCLLCLIYAIRYRHVFKNKKLAMWFWIVGVISLIISTVYLRYHWVIDVIAGILLTILVYYFTEWIFGKWIKLRNKQKIEFEEFIVN